MASIAQRRYNHRVLVLSLVYTALLFATVYLFRRGVLHGAPAYAAAILPALPIVGIFAAIGRYLVEESDEYQRVMMARRSLVATGLAMSVATVWGFLENFGLVPHLYAYCAAILWFLGLGVGACADRLRQRGAEA